MSDSQEKIELEEEELAVEEEEEDVPLRTDFTLPRKIKITKLIISLVINFLIGGVSFSMSIVWFVNPPEINTFYRVFASFLLIFGGILLFQFPLSLGRTLNTRLILGKKSVSYRNTFFWNKVSWADVQDILIQQKLTRDLAENELVGIGIVRFRTVTKGYIFIGDTYPVIVAEEIIQSIKEVFEIALEETDYKLKINFERPSAQMRYIYFIKELKE
ncbi:MAG: hypothetical protein KGD59_15225 [Candidatus Heimdallarchaeota archaeon]|nr:hypothetical protein [Candidatus Heimdallarchaeota archaeon]MBY8995899.1 hypothetical protein [Candidatus Heimdallarchaeota archaeon]